MYRLNPVRIRRGVIWARLPSFWLPSLDGGPGGKARREGGEEPRVCVTVCVCARGCVCVLYKPEPCGVFLCLNEPDCLCYHNPFSLSSSLQTRVHTHTQVHTVTHTPDSCVWLGKCLWLTPLPSHPLASFLDLSLNTPIKASYCYSVHPSLSYALLLKIQFCSAGDSHSQLSLDPLRWPILIRNKQLFTILCPLESLGPNVSKNMPFSTSVCLQ